ncbi:hypothetical protein J2X14_001197 [Pantoea alhagi]|nr:hypothetical protein [Pantoea alhagi]
MGGVTGLNRGYFREWKKQTDDRVIVGLLIIKTLPLRLPGGSI